MASIRNFKKEINYVLGELIDAVTIWELTTGKENSQQASQIVNDIIATYDSYVEKINNKEERKKAGYFKSLKKAFHTDAVSIIEKINGLS